ncbi:putative HTH-type transcriptional regulator YisR [Paenibacillus faecis]|uniref:helix-turn-helix transcriptional regulator n=1 Tax=Paenibacillus faecis TaxID=862114 RepID=UPI001B2CE06D|nr:AraC family transcriptional regulator [Paenibacillus faecis]GIO88158.1 putative HTH-type transcriptional regulator YisR [Paenibacillus faecis]
MIKAADIVHIPAPPAPYFLECGHTVYAAGDQHPNRKNLGVFDLLLVERGTLFIGEEEKRWELGAGETLLLLPDRYHYAFKPCEDGCSFYWLHFQTVCPWQESAAGSLPALYQPEEHIRVYGTAPYSIQLPKHWHLPYPAQTYRLMDKLLAYTTERQSSAYWSGQQTFDELIRMMDLRQLEQYASPVVTVAEQTEAYIKNHYRSEVTGESLSEALHFHYNYITRCLKQVYGMTPHEYLLHYRLEQAKLLLLKTEWPVSEIAKYVGFRHAPYFSNRFTIKNGCSPQKFRKQYSQ